MSIEPGALYVVATPIGNMDDLSDRARTVLAGVHVIAAEDTRHTGRLLQRLGIERTLLSLHEHNERERVPQLIERLRRDEAVALVSDAGTPTVSDPGFPLVSAAHDAGLRVIPIPGASAILAALAASGQATHRFAFEGFLPSKPQARRNALKALAGEPRTLVFYESSHRIDGALADLEQAFGGERSATLCRELTKSFETVRRASLAELGAWVRDDANQRRGEIVLVVAGAPESDSANADLDQVLEALLAELPPARAAAVAARLTGIPRREAYARAMQLSGSAGN
ncbi:MAG: 16S rRNA (cytidine(1402)-2'-O)-methyltransferase [Halofilum sp. (in: g-proteobacteria)]|nr:16S rRNA (cytidine(1402)-2'-O)-methyltransferase [Halofilum sp. (in: g-proteobacteria)]